MAAHKLHPEHEITVYEAGERIGGHTHTVPVEAADGTHWIDTGFIVFNDRNYPDFEALLAELGVASQPSHMGFSVSDGGRFEYSGTPWGLFARPAHLLSPSFLGMLRDWRRFNREARALIGMNGTAPSLGALARAAGLLPPLRRAADRSPGERRLVGRPGADVELPGQLHGRVLREPRHVQPPRPAAAGGPSAAARAATWRRSWRRGATGCGCGRRCGGSSACRTGCGSRPTAARARIFDQVVVATHSDQALALLGDPSAAEREVLGAIPYQRNEAVLHTDASLMPRRRAAWSSWNFHLSEEPAAGSTVTYWMNNLQRLRTEQHYFVTLNRGGQIDPAKVIRRISYDHPVYTREGVAAQARHAEISGHAHRTHYCGAYWGWGFHEDGVVSALRVCDEIAATHPTSFPPSKAPEGPKGCETMEGELAA